MKISKYFNSLLFGALIIPTQDFKDWKIEQFSKIPKNEVTTSKEGLRIKVENSASPLIFPLKTKNKILGFKIKGEFFGLPQFSDVTKQGEKGFDDYALRLGFVIRGDKKLTGFKKLIAADWVKNLFSLVNDGSGLDRVQFFNVTQNQNQLGKERLHPSTDLFEEHFFKSVSVPGTFLYEHQFTTKQDVAALWLSIDGDDTKSKYEVLISELVVIEED